MGDTNVYPKPSKESVWKSPDIIPYGTNVCENPKETFLGNNFNKEFPKDILGGVENYVYIRGENTSGASLKGDMYLYYSDSTMLLAPTTWKPIKSTKGGDCVKFKANVNEKIVCDNTDDGIFAVKPEKPEGHPCLISRIVTASEPAPIPDLKDITDFSIFIRSEQSKGYAQRNLRYVETAKPTFTLTEQMTNPFTTPITDAYVLLTMRGVPIGSEYQMTCPGSQPGCYLEIPKTKLTQDTYTQEYSVGIHISNMPGKFSYPLYVNFWLNKNIDGRFKVTPELIAIYSSDSRAYKYGSPLNQLATANLCEEGHLLDKVTHAKRIDELALKLGIRVGSCTHIARPAQQT